MMKKISVDIVIVGGGIAGLYTLNRARSKGYSALLLETQALGAGQTIRAQGIIHGGLKYALTGFLNPSANAIQKMPERWQSCLRGQGDVDLSAVKILSPDQLLMSTGSIGSEVTAFFASKAMKSRVQKLNTAQYPHILQNSNFKGHVWRLEEMVLDMHSLVENLSKPHAPFLLKINSEQDLDWQLEKSSPTKLQGLQIHGSDDTLELSAKRYFFTAGEGNAKLCQNLHNPTLMQCRPLQMVIVKLEQHSPLFAHCIDQAVNPRMTITSHIAKDGKMVWYLGGQLAEDGAHKTKEAQLAFAKQELNVLFPWLDLNNAIFESFFINRAEPKQADGKRPESIFMNTLGNISVAWPTKLAFAPLLADHFIDSLSEAGIEPEQQVAAKMSEVQAFCESWPKARVAAPVWDQLY